MPFAANHRLYSLSRKKTIICLSLLTFISFSLHGCKNIDNIYNIQNISKNNKDSHLKDNRYQEKNNQNISNGKDNKGEKGKDNAAASLQRNKKISNIDIISSKKNNIPSNDKNKLDNNTDNSSKKAELSSNNQPIKAQETKPTHSNISSKSPSAHHIVIISSFYGRNSFIGHSIIDSTNLFLKEYSENKISIDFIDESEISTHLDIERENNASEEKSEFAAIPIKDKNLFNNDNSSTLFITTSSSGNMTNFLQNRGISSPKIIYISKEYESLEKYNIQFANLFNKISSYSNNRKIPSQIYLVSDINIQDKNQSTNYSSSKYIQYRHIPLRHRESSAKLSYIYLSLSREIAKDLDLQEGNCYLIVPEGDEHMRQLQQALKTAITDNRALSKIYFISYNMNDILHYSRPQNNIFRRKSANLIANKGTIKASINDYEFQSILKYCNESCDNKAERNINGNIVNKINRCCQLTEVWTHWNSLKHDNNLSSHVSAISGKSRNDCDILYDFRRRFYEIYGYNCGHYGSEVISGIAGLYGYRKEKAR